MSDSLTEEQRIVVESWGEGIAVLAGAGSGKTYTLVRKIRELLGRNPEARFAAVSFTEKSASDLRSKLTRLTLELQGRPLQGHVVATIHGLCSSIIREYPREAGFDGDETMLSETEAETLWLQALDGLFFEELPAEIEESFGRLSSRETRGELYSLLARVRDLESNGVLVRMENAPDLRSVAEYSLGRYDRLKRRRGALDFNDLELGAARALRSDRVAADYRRRFDLVLVDEFQDTNPVQAGILTRLARPGLSNLVVVGDPKQSIYRFRDADVSVFEEFCSRMPVRVALTKNFRSVPGILEFSNSVCAPAFSTSGMEYHSLVPGREPDPKTAPVEFVEVRSPEDLARFLRSEVDRGVALSEMALLLRTIRGRNEKWLKALTAAGIPIAVESGGLLWNDPRSRELACFLRWWSNPANEISGIAFLRAPWIGIPESEIEEWRKTDPGMLHAFLRSNHPAARLLRPLRLAPGRIRPGELLLKLLELPGVEEELGVHVLALWHRSEELSEEGLGFGRVADRIFTACDEERRERAVPPPRNSGQLRVMTIHGSKGLEFPRVILLDFPEKTKRAAKTPLFFWDRDRGAFLAGRDESGERLKKDEVEREWKSLETEKELAESKRVLYVALTRAKESLLLVLPTTDDEKKRESIEKHREKIPDPTAVDFWRGWIEPALRTAKKREPADRPSTTVLPRETEESGRLPTGPKPSFLPRRPRHSVSEWNLLSRCERSYEWTVIRPIVPTEEEEWRELVETERSREDRERGRGTSRPRIAQNEIGTRVHRALELEDAGGLNELERILGESVFRAGPVVRWMEESPWMRTEEGRSAWKELAFEVPVPPASPSVASSSSSAVSSSDILIGALDRLVRDPDGSYTILDFKITARKKSPEALLETYRTQLNLYASALESLVPESRGKTRAFLVHIAGGQVTEIEVPLEASRLGELRGRAESILRGRSGEARPGSLCEVCDHLDRCPEGRRFRSSSND